MANDITTKVWDLDTAGVVSVTGVIIEGISITWKTASAGTVLMSVVNEQGADRTAGAEVFSAKSLGATSAAIDNMTYFWPIKTTIPSLHLTTVADVDKLLVYTK
jgi:hypothetical protein